MKAAVCQDDSWNLDTLLETNAEQNNQELALLHMWLKEKAVDGLRSVSLWRCTLAGPGCSKVD